MTAAEETFADLWATGTFGTHPLAHIRERLAGRGVIGAAELKTARPGATVVVAGLVTHRQQPGTARGVVFLSLEDETGMANVICPPPVWERHRSARDRCQRPARPGPGGAHGSGGQPARHPAAAAAGGGRQRQPRLPLSRTAAAGRRLVSSARRARPVPPTRPCRSWPREPPLVGQGLEEHEPEARPVERDPACAAAACAGRRRGPRSAARTPRLSSRRTTAVPPVRACRTALVTSSETSSTAVSSRWATCHAASAS